MGQVLQIFAYAYDRHTSTAWKRLLGTPRLENVHPPPENLGKAGMVLMLQNPPVSSQAHEEFGSLLEPRRRAPMDQEPPSSHHVLVQDPHRSRIVPLTVAPTQATQAYAMAMRDHIRQQKSPLDVFESAPC